MAKNKVVKVDLYPIIEEDMLHINQITGPRGGMRAYQKPGDPLPLWSVTTILSNTVAKPALMNWYNKQGREAVAERLTPHVGTVLSDGLLEQALKDAAVRPRKTASEAADIGTRAHDFLSEYIESRIKGEEQEVRVPMDLFPVWESFQAWEKDAGIEQYLKTEFAVYSELFRYAGSVDALAYNSEGRFMVLDWKTGRGLYPEMALQVAAYSNALSLPLRMKVDGSLNHQWDTWQHIEPWVIRLGKEEAEFEARRVTNPQLALDGFLNAMQMWYSLDMPGLTPKAKEELGQNFSLPDGLPTVW
jgi:hypothetical protein